MANSGKSKYAGPVKKSVAWPSFAERLAGVLAGLEEDQFLVISIKKLPYYIQFAGQGSYGLRIETTGNHYLDNESKLNTSQILHLQNMGWHPPTNTPDATPSEKDPDGSPNFFIDFVPPVDFKTTAQFVVETLTDVHQLPHPGFLKYEAFDSSDNLVEFPSLGMKRIVRQNQQDSDFIRIQMLAVVKELTKIPDLDYDQNGDLGIRFGSVNIFIRYLAKSSAIRLHAPLVFGVAASESLYIKLNEFNAGSDMLHFFHRNDIISAVTAVPASPFVSQHLIVTLQEFSEICDGTEDYLAALFGGKMGNDESLPVTVIQ